MLFLNEKDIREIFQYDEIINSVEKAYNIYEENNFSMPDRISVNNKTDELLFMPSFTENIFGTKILTIFPENSKNNLPVIDGILLLNNINTGEIVSMMDGKTITEIRTGAVGGVGIKHTTKEDCKSVGLIGIGVQGLIQLQYACAVRNIETINIFNRNTEKTEKFIEKLKEKISKDIIIKTYDSTYDLVKNSEIIITTTNSKNPVVPDDEKLLKGKHFIGIGSYQKDMREYPDSLLKIVDNIYIDTEFAKEESGDLYQPLKDNILSEEKIINFSKFLKNKDNIGETTLYKSVGMSLFDIVVGEDIYKKAVKNKLGQTIKL